MWESLASEGGKEDNEAVVVVGIKEAGGEDGEDWEVFEVWLGDEGAEVLPNLEARTEMDEDCESNCDFSFFKVAKPVRAFTKAILSKMAKELTALSARITELSLMATTPNKNMQGVAM